MVKTLRIVDLDQSDRSEQSEHNEPEQHRVSINSDHPDKKKRTPNSTVHAELKQTSKLRKSKPKPAPLALQKSMETISPLPLRLPLPRTLELPIPVPVIVPLFSPSVRHLSTELTTKLDPEQQLLVPQVDPELQPVTPLTDPELQPTNLPTGDSVPSTPREQPQTKAQEEEIQIITVDDNPPLPSHSTSSEVAQPSEEVEQKNIAEIAEILVEFNTSSSSEAQLPPIKQLESFGNDCDSWLSHLTARQIQQLPPIHIAEEDDPPSEYRCRSFSASAYSSSYFPSFLSEKRSMSFDSLNLPESTQVSLQGQKEHKGASKLNSDSYFLEDVDAEMNQQTPNQVALQIDLEGNLITNWEQNVDHQLEAQSYEIYNQNHQHQIKYFDEPNNTNNNLQRLNNNSLNSLNFPQSISDNHSHHRQGEASSNENFSLIDLPTDENIDSFLNHGSLDDISLDHLQQFSNQHFSETPSTTFHAHHSNSAGISSQNQLNN